MTNERLRPCLLEAHNVVFTSPVLSRYTLLPCFKWCIVMHFIWLLCSLMGKYQLPPPPMMLFGCLVIHSFRPVGVWVPRWSGCRVTPHKAARSIDVYVSPDQLMVMTVSLGAWCSRLDSTLISFQVPSFQNTYGILRLHFFKSTVQPLSH